MKKIIATAVLLSVSIVPASAASGQIAIRSSHQPVLAGASTHARPRVPYRNVTWPVFYGAPYYGYYTSCAPYAYGYGFGYPVMGAGCAILANPNAQGHATGGALLGGVLGAIIGHNSGSRNAWAGAALGGTIGYLAGSAADNAAAREQQAAATTVSRPPATRDTTIHTPSTPAPPAPQQQAAPAYRNNTRAQAPMSQANSLFGRQ